MNAQIKKIKSVKDLTKLVRVSKLDFYSGIFFALLMGTLFYFFGVSKPSLLLYGIDKIFVYALSLIGLALTGYGLFGVVANKEFVVAASQIYLDHSNTDAYTDTLAALLQTLLVVSILITCTMLVMIALNCQDAYTKQEISVFFTSEYIDFFSAAAGCLYGFVLGFCITEVYGFFLNIFIFSRRAAQFELKKSVQDSAE